MSKYTYFSWDTGPEPEDTVYYRVYDYESPRGPEVEMLSQGEWIPSAWGRTGTDYWTDTPPFEHSRQKLSIEDADALGLVE